MSTLLFENLDIWSLPSFRSFRKVLDRVIHAKLTVNQLIRLPGSLLKKALAYGFVDHVVAKVASVRCNQKR
jgi:hypothetical protein